MMSERLFVYGSLRPDHAPSEISAVVQGLQLVGPGTIQAKLYDLGEYPGVILEEGTHEKVPGVVLDLVRNPEALASLDSYEEYDPADPNTSLFKRLQTAVTFPDGHRESCWVYVYNRAVMPRLDLASDAPAETSSSRHFTEPR